MAYTAPSQLNVMFRTGQLSCVLLVVLVLNVIDQRERLKYWPYLFINCRLNSFSFNGKYTKFKSLLCWQECLICLAYLAVPSLIC